MTPKQARFVEEYLIDLNATQAAIRVGYSAATAYSQGQRLLKHVEVAAALKEAQEARAERVSVDQDWVLSRLMTVAERCLTEDFNPAGANGALGLLGRHLSMFTDKLEVGATDALAERLLAARGRVGSGA